MIRRKPPIKRPAARATPKKPKPQPQRPLSIKAALEALHAERPEHIPAGATLVVAWIDLPGENAQRKSWHAALDWKAQLKLDFAACLKLQGHPGLIAHPRVHVQLHVAVPGDPINSYSRVKYVIDKLQVLRASSYVRKGKLTARSSGLLGLISDDKHLTLESCTVEEIRSGLKARKSTRRVQVWVWEAA